MNFFHSDTVLSVSLTIPFKNQNKIIRKGKGTCLLLNPCGGETVCNNSLLRTEECTKKANMVKRPQDSDASSAVRIRVQTEDQHPDIAGDETDTRT